MDLKLVIKKEDFDYVEILFIIMVSVCPYISMMVKILMLLVIIAANYKNILRIPNVFYVFLVAMAIPSLIDLFNITSDYSYSGNNLWYPFCFFVGAVIATKYSLNVFLIKFEKIVYILAILSLIGMSVYYIAPSMIDRFPTYQFYDLTHRTVYFFNYIYAQGFLMVRNSGIAWEPGVFQILLNLGFAISVTRYNELNYKKVVVYTLAIILTRSTTGLLILMINLILVIKKKKVFIVLLVIVLLVFSTELYTIFNEQITTKWIGSLAFSTRFDKTINALHYSWKHIFGIGSTKYNAVYLQANIGSFDSYTQIMMRYGYGLLIVLLFTLLKIYKCDWSIAVILLLSMLTESMWGTVLFTTIYFIYLIDREGNNKGYNTVKKGRMKWRRKPSL